jgi:hypothetical protein
MILLTPARRDPIISPLSRGRASSIAEAPSRQWSSVRRISARLERKKEASSSRLIARSIEVSASRQQTVLASAFPNRAQVQAGSRSISRAGYANSNACTKRFEFYQDGVVVNIGHFILAY